jgi:flavin-dependent dehydrogenase
MTRFESKRRRAKCPPDISSARTAWFSAVRKAFFPRDLVSYAPAIEVLIAVGKQTMADFDDRMVFDFGGMPRGYGWIFPKKDHLNVGVYSMFPRRSIRDDLKRFMSRYETLRAHDDVKILGHSIPTQNRAGSTPRIASSSSATPPASPSRSMEKGSTSR